MNTILETEIVGLKVAKIFESANAETLLISLEADKIFPTHKSHRDAYLIILEGDINFYIENELVNLKTHQTYSFNKDIEHYVKANKNSKFLIIR